MAEDNSTFVELSPDNLSRVPEKGILKHGRLDAWEDSPQEDQVGEHPSDVERTLKTINGYHEEILEALHTASQRMGDTKRSPSSDDSQRKSIADIEYAALTIMKSAQEQQQQRGSGGRGGTCDTSEEPCPIRIRNLEDLLRQLEHHPPHHHDPDQHHTSPAHSDEIRLSEPEADRHYLLGGDGRGDGKADSSLQYLLGRLQAGSASVKSAAAMTHRSKTGRYSVEEDEMLEDDDDDADDASGEDDEDGSTYSSHHLVRSASEEALPVTTGGGSSGGGKDYAYPRKSRPRQSSREPPCDYVPSPQPSEDSYANSSEDNAFLPANIPQAPRAGRAPKIQPLPQGPTVTSTGSLPSSSKRKPRKKSPEYKV